MFLSAKQSTLPLVLAVAALSATGLAQDRIAIKAQRIITQGPEGEIENGVIVIEGGRITAIGKDVKVPWDVPVLEGKNLVAMPGFIEAHTFRGMDRPNENVDVAPFLSVTDSIDPINFYFEDSLRSGITTINVQQGNGCVIGGQGLIVKPFGLTVEQMLVRPEAGLKLSASPKQGFSSATQAQALRNAFGDLKRYLEQQVEDRKEGGERAKREALFQGKDRDPEKAKGRAMGGSSWKVEGLDLVPRDEIDGKQAPLLDLVEGRRAAFFYCARPMDIRTALEIARDNGFLARTTLVLEPGCWKAADVVAEAGVPVVLSGSLVYTERDPITGKEIETFVPAEYKKRGVRFALSSTNSTSESLWYQAATAVGLGLTRKEALDAVTTTPAEILALGKRLGTLEVGKDGNVVLFSGDPLSVRSWVEFVVLDGKQVYDRSKDIRVKALLEGKLPAGTAPMGEEKAEGHVHDDDDPVKADEKKEEKKEDKKPGPPKEDKKEEEKPTGGGR